MSRPPRASRAHGPPPWVAHRWHGERPPWWPEDREWPPQRHGRGDPRRLFARIVVGALAVFLVVDLVVVLLVSLVARALGIVDLAPEGVVAVVGALLLFVAAMGLMSGQIRRAGLPLAELMDAVGHVAAGDYAVRVDPRGPGGIRRLVAAFNEMVERLATADERRRRLLADVTHELRTPLTVVQGQLEGAIDGVYPRDEEHLRAILDETRHMARIIEDLRTLSLAESGALSLTREAVAIGEIVDDAVEAYRGQADAAGVTLAAAVEQRLPLVDVDTTRVRQVLENLLSNALRYTPRGGRIDVTAVHDRADAVAVSVSDTGRGIPPADLGRVFDRFQRAADSQGTGLGLSIARDLVRAHGGEIAVESDGEGRGATFRFTLPVAS